MDHGVHVQQVVQHKLPSLLQK